jgi:hypothetical protein
MFMSAQQVLRWTIGADSPGTTGAREARLTANTANNSRAGNFIHGDIITHPDFGKSSQSRRVSEGVLLIFWMLGRIAIALGLIVALTTAPFQVAARTCILSDAPIQKACKPGCCANKTCCATSKKNTAPVSQPFAKSASGSELNATCIATITLIAPGHVSLDRQLSLSRAPSCALVSPQLAVLCTFLI